MYRISVYAFALLSLCGTGWCQSLAQGRVFLDENRNGLPDPHESGLADVAVSNGEAVVKTDAQGRWQLPIGDHGAIFVIKPAHYQLPANEAQIPRHYYLHSKTGSPSLTVPGIAPTGPLPPSIDFPLYPHPENKPFSGLFFGDTQARGLREVNFVTHDVVEECLDTDAIFGVSLGDIVADDPALFSEISESIAQIGIPWYNVFGNHDNNRAALANEYSDDTFERFFGPSTYAFEYGEVAFIPLNTIFFPPNSGRYTPAFTEKQLTFVKNYLALVPREKLVVLMMHVPIVGCKRYKEMLALLADRPHTLTIAAHTHMQRHVFLDKKRGWTGENPHHLFINATVSGSWWCGSFDERGIPHATMNDGAPNGYSKITFDGNQYQIAFKAASRPADYQMNVYLADDVPVGQLTETEVLANIFAGSERSRAEMQIDEDGPWIPMEYTVTIDPECLRMHEQSPYLDGTVEGKKLDTVFGWKMDYPSKSYHMWKAVLPKDLEIGTHTLTVRTSDMFGQHHTGKRIFRVRSGAQ
jgi:hypothetical protein